MKIIGIILFTFTSLMISSQPKVYFINIEDGDSLESPFLVQFGLSNMGIAPAGIDKENTGHHHLLINVEDINFNSLYHPHPIIFILEEGKQRP